MKTTSKKSYLTLIISLAVIMVISTSTKSMAVVDSDPPIDTCARVTTLSANNANVAAHVDNMKADFTSRTTDISNKQAEVDQQAATFRASIATKFDAKIADLKKQIGLSNEQSTAIDVYATNMRSAETTRESAIDAARAAYRTALSSEVTTHQQTMQNAAIAFETSITDAFTVAQTNCGNGTSAILTLRSKIGIARQTLSSIQQSSKIGDIIQQLSQTRNAATKAASDAFAASAKTYTTTLKTFFAA